MARFHGAIGFVHTVETAPGKFEEVPTESDYTGDILRSSASMDNSQKVVGELSISNRISVLGDKYLYENFEYMRYIWLEGVRWKITNVELQRPRITLSIGGVYNGPE